MLETATLGCWSTVWSFMDCTACTSSEISRAGRVGVGCYSNPRSIFIHSVRNWSHHGRPLRALIFTIHLWDHAALTADRRVVPNGVVRDSPGWSHRMTVGSVLTHNSWQLGPCIATPHVPPLRSISRLSKHAVSSPVARILGTPSH